MGLWPSTARAFSNDAFECYVAAYSHQTQPPRLINPSLRVGLHPQGNDPVLHIYGPRLRVLPLKNLRISDRFMRGRIHSDVRPDLELGGIMLRQRGLMLTFNLSQLDTDANQSVNWVFEGECSSVGYQQP